MNNPTPAHKHDCDKCNHLGTIKSSVLTGSLRWIDLYFCPGEFPTLLARVSGEGSDYQALPLAVCAKMGPGAPLALAYKIYQDRMQHLSDEEKFCSPMSE